MVQSAKRGRRIRLKRQQVPGSALTWIYIVQEAPLKVGRKSHQDAFAATRRPPAEKIYPRTYFNTQTNNSEYKTRLQLFCTFIGVLLERSVATRGAFRASGCNPASPLPFIPIVRFTCLPMVLLPSNMAADLNSYDQENIFIPNTFPRSKAASAASSVRLRHNCACLHFYLLVFVG